MRKLVYYVGISLDGYIAGPGGEIDFYPVSDEYMTWMSENFPETLPTHVRKHFGFDDAPNKAYDTMVMGLGTYQPALDMNISSPYGHVRQYVVSNSLEKIDDPAVTLVRDPLPLVRELKQQDGLDIWLGGGGKLAGSLLPEIDQLVIKSYPVLAGRGVLAVSGEFQPTQFAPTKQVSFASGVYVTWFDRK